MWDIQILRTKKELSFCVRCVDNDHEDFLGYYQIPNIQSNIIVEITEGSLMRMNVPIPNMRGQTYDGASNMFHFTKNGVFH